MLTLEKPSDFETYVGQVLGSSDWLTIDQARIDKFAEATGDHQWIHVDVERAKREMPDGKTIAHGYLTLSLIAGLGPQIFRVEKRSRGVNYGSNKVRFINPVPSGARVRLTQKVKAVEAVEGGRRVYYESTIEIEGAAKPALVAETISIIYE